MTEEDKNKVIRELIKISPWYEVKDIKEDMHLHADLDFDNLDFIELLVNLESAFLTTIDSEKWFDGRITVGEVFKIVENSR